MTKFPATDIQANMRPSNEVTGAAPKSAKNTFPQRHSPLEIKLITIVNNTELEHVVQISQRASKTWIGLPHRYRHTSSRPERVARRATQTMTRNPAWIANGTQTGTMTALPSKRLNMSNVTRHSVRIDRGD